MMGFTSLADIGHRFLVEPSGPALQPHEKEILAELRPSAFMFRARNFDFKAPYDVWLSKFSKLLEEIRACVGHEKLLLSIDHEGGRVVRPPAPITRFPYAAQWKDLVAEVTKAMAVELRSIGMNTSWAPVADVLTNPESKAIGLRAFSDVASVASQRACEMASVLQANGIAPGAKHFPGYGPVTEDAHYDLPIASIPLEEWDEIHLVPFVDLIEREVPFLMTAHIMCPALDANDQATLSKPILVDLLRTKLGFKGVVVADALGMGAIRDEIEAADAIVKALHAELDIFCYAGDSVDLNTARTAAQQILSAVNEGRVSEELLERSRARITAAINALPQHRPEQLDPEVFMKHSELAHQLDPNDEWREFQYIPKGFD